MPDGWLGLDWGNVPAWVGSLLTGSSLGLAAFTYFRNSAERRQAREDTERAQAARVSSWRANARRAIVHNGNDVAVTVQVFVLGGQADGRTAASDRVVFGPGETRALALPAYLEDHLVALTLSLVDSYGRAWVRRDSGTLVRVTEGMEGHREEPPDLSSRLRWEDR
ncbi:MAG TPA: hypothetical protein VFM55_24970 [Micromonosporaceae bacterium]|nr:hypothetical protein [Micromonosporaceae bacterium]